MTKKQTAELRRLLKRYETSKNKLGDNLAVVMNLYNASNRELDNVSFFLDKIEDNLPDLKKKIKKS